MSRLQGGHWENDSSLKAERCKVVLKDRFQVKPGNNVSGFLVFVRHTSTERGAPTTALQQRPAA